MNLVTVSKQNVTETGFFCYMSKRKSEGYQRKLNWLKDRFDEGLKIEMLDLRQGGRGFIEYIPGEFAWRAINAEGYIVIHCIWVAGQSKGKGYGSLLLNKCIEDARKSRKKGVAIVTSRRNWLAGSEFFQKHGFDTVATQPPFELLVRRFRTAPTPSFSGDFERKLKSFKNGLTVIRSDQCPYIDASVRATLEAAKELGIKTRIIELKSAEDVRRLSPSPYGVFQIIYEERLVSYHPIAKKNLMESLSS